MAHIDITSNIVIDIKAKLEKASRDKLFTVQDAQLDTQFIKGNQNLFINTIDQVHYDLAVDESAPDSKYTFNRMGQIYQKRSQILIRNIPDIKAKPFKKRIEYDRIQGLSAPHP